jgi:hypothetical protein
MKLIAIFALIFLAGCSHPPPIQNKGWVSVEWRYTAPSGKDCATVAKQPDKFYDVIILGDRGQPILSESLTFDSDREVETFVEAICAKR